MTYEQWKHQNWETLCDSFEERMATAYSPRERIMIEQTGRLELRFEQHARQLFSESEGNNDRS